MREESGILTVEVKFDESKRTAKGEGNFLAQD